MWSGPSATAQLKSGDCGGCRSPLPRAQPSQLGGNLFLSSLCPHPDQALIPSCPSSCHPPQTTEVQGSKERPRQTLFPSPTHHRVPATQPRLGAGLVRQVQTALGTLNCL